MNNISQLFHGPLRVSFKGPTVSTKESLTLSSKVLDKCPSYLGERFTTREWFPGMVSKTITNIKENKSYFFIILYHIILI